MTALDPASLQVLISRLTGIAEEMGAVLRRAAYSPNIKERADCSAALFTAGGELLVQAEHIPVHLGSMPASVRAALDASGDRIEPGDQVVLNDPYAGGTHLNDVTLVAPCFAGDELVGWAANRAHHADLGGMAPGSMPPEASSKAGFTMSGKVSRFVRDMIARQLLITNEKRCCKRASSLASPLSNAICSEFSRTRTRLKRKSASKRC